MKESDRGPRRVDKAILIADPRDSNLEQETKAHQRTKGYIGIGPSLGRDGTALVGSFCPANNPRNKAGRLYATRINIVKYIMWDVCFFS